MKKIMYSRSSDGGISIVYPSPKEKIEKILGALSGDDYHAHILRISIPEEALNVREIDDSDIPSSREFRNAWCDVTPDPMVDIDLSKAKDIQLELLRAIRNEALLKTDWLMTRALEDADTQAINYLKIKRQDLRDATEPLKALKAEGYNDEEILDQIRKFGKLNV